jgi:hypothetical protein
MSTWVRKPGLGLRPAHASHGGTCDGETLPWRGSPEPRIRPVKKRRIEVADQDTPKKALITIDRNLLGIWSAPLIGSDIMISLSRQPDGSLILKGRRKIFATDKDPAEKMVFYKAFGADEQEKAEAEILALCENIIREFAERGLAEPETKVTVMLMRDYASLEEFTSAFVRAPGLTLKDAAGNLIDLPQEKSPVEAWLRGLLEGRGAKVVSIEASGRWARAVAEFPEQGTRVVTADVVDRPLHDGQHVSFSEAQVDAIRKAGSEIHVMFASDGLDAAIVLTRDLNERV